MAFLNVGTLVARYLMRNCRFLRYAAPSSGAAPCDGGGGVDDRSVRPLLQIPARSFLNLLPPAISVACCFLIVALRSLLFVCRAAFRRAELGF